MFLPAHLLEIIHARMHARSCARVSAFHCQRTLCAGWLNVFMFTPSAAAIHFIHPMGNDAPMCFSGLINQCDTLTAFGGVHAAGVVLFASATDEALKAAFATASNLYLFTSLRIQQAQVPAPVAGRLTVQEAPAIMQRSCRLTLLIPAVSFCPHF